MADAAAEPLIQNDSDFPNDPREQYDDEDADVEIDESTLVSPGLFIWGLTICAGISGLLFGYEYVALGALSRALLALQETDNVLLVRALFHPHLYRLTLICLRGP